MLHPVGLYATPDCIARMRPVLTPGDLPHNYILFRGVARTVSLPFRKEKQKVNIDVHSRFRSNNSVALISMALSGLGIAYLPNYIARKPRHRETGPAFTRLADG